jgi:hypothetical protein
MSTSPTLSGQKFTTLGSIDPEKSVRIKRYEEFFKIPPMTAVALAQKVIVWVYLKWVKTMIVLEFKAYGKPSQCQAVDEAICTVQFIRNSCLRLWMDTKGIGKNDLQKYCAILAQKIPFAKELMASLSMYLSARILKMFAEENFNKPVVGGL